MWKLSTVKKKKKPADGGGTEGDEAEIKQELTDGLCNSAREQGF